MNKLEEIELIEKIFQSYYVNPSRIVKIFLKDCVNTKRGAQTAFIFEIVILGYDYTIDSCEYEDPDECERDRKRLIEIVHSYK